MRVMTIMARRLMLGGGDGRRLLLFAMAPASRDSEPTDAASGRHKVLYRMPLVLISAEMKTCLGHSDSVKLPCQATVVEIQKWRTPAVFPRLAAACTSIGK